MTPAELKHLYQRKVSAMKARPAFARATGKSAVRVADGFGCDIDCGGTLVHADQPVAEGGGGTGPTPGQLMRAGVVSCLAMGYKVWSVRLDVPIDEVEVEMTCELDARGQLGVDPAVAPGWSKISYTVRITSNAPEADVRALVDTADQRSPMLGSLDRGIERSRTLEIVRRRA